jgi:hypothetical protein
MNDLVGLLSYMVAGKKVDQVNNVNLALKYIVIHTSCTFADGRLHVLQMCSPSRYRITSTTAVSFMGLNESSEPGPIPYHCAVGE